MARRMEFGLRLAAAACVVGVAATSVVAGGSPPADAATTAAKPTHLLVMPNSAEARLALGASNARTLAAYGAFTVVEASNEEVAGLVAAGGEVRDDMREMRIGSSTSDPAIARTSLNAAARNVGTDGYGLAVVQYIGPLKDEWIAAVRATGVEVVSYMAQNGQLVSGDSGALGALAKLAGAEPFIRAVTPYVVADKLVLDASVDKRMPSLARSGSVDVVISTVAGKGGEAARAELARIAKPNSEAVAVAGIVQHRVSMSAASVGTVAALGGVVAVEPFVAPVLHDERAARIVDGQLNASFQPVLGTGHRAFLLANGFTALSPVIIDVTDEGVDKGVVPVPAGAHPDFYRAGKTTNLSRLVYAQEATAADTDARDCGGHGTNVASIASGYNLSTGASVEDAQGFNYGMGIQPFGQIGATKIFNCLGSFDVTTSLTALRNTAYAAGGRISNNSWGASVGGAYTASSQEQDQLVRDAQPGVAGNQQFTIVFSAGNSGSGANTIGAPGTAKNVITVGASENVRPIGATDGCGVTDAGANSARDIINFSSRGPTDDGRIKPDIVAPGTHVSGAQPQTGADFNGSGTCNPQFPTGSGLYTLVSGTSQAAPEVTGLASLVHTWFRTNFGGGTKYPSPAMTKALIVNAATDLAGGDDGAGGVNAAVPTQVQGWGRVNLGTLLNGTSRSVFDQTPLLGATGQNHNRFYNVAASGSPLRVTLVWTDPPGPTTGNSFVNDLDLEVTAGGQTYKGNVFSGGFSATGGTADPRNNLENVFLPAGINGALKVRVVAKNIAGNGVPGNVDATDQDYALVVSNVNGPVASLAVLANAGFAFTPAGDHDAVLEPGEAFTLGQSLKNVGTATATSVAGVLTANASDATIAQGSRTWANIAANATRANTPRFSAIVKSTLACGNPVRLSLTVTTTGSSLTFPINLPTGQPAVSGITSASADVPKAIPDANATGVTSNLVLSGGGIISDMDVTIGQITHTFDGDLQIDLTSPGGTTVRLFNNNGSSGDNLTNTVFDDAAATSLSAGTAPFTGAFKPFSPLSVFNGQPVNGTWKLTVRDVAAEDIGTLSGWSTTRKGFVCS